MSPRIHNTGSSGAIQTGSCSANIRELSSVLSASHPHSMAQRDPGRNPPRKRQGTCKHLQTSPLQYSEHRRERLRASGAGPGPETGNLQRSQKRSRAANGIWDGLTERPFHAQLGIPPASSCPSGPRSRRQRFQKTEVSLHDVPSNPKLTFLM